MDRRWIYALLASTSLTGLPSAQAAVVAESVVGGFGGSFAAATPIDGPAIDLIGNVDNYQGDQTADHFIVTGGPVETFSLRFVASRVGSLGISSSEGGSLYFGVDQASFGNSEGGSFPFGLPTTIGTVGQQTYPAGEGVSLTLSSFGSGFSSSTASYNIYPAGLEPILSFYDDSGALTDSFTLTEGTSFLIDGILPAGEGLNFSIAAPFDYTVDFGVTQQDVPEPASGALLGLGIAGAVAARRGRKRII